MARPKYKIDQRVETSTNFGKITEIRTNTTGHRYQLSDESIVDEDAVTASYRLVTPRKPKSAAKSIKKASQAKTVDRQAAN